MPAKSEQLDQATIEARIRELGQIFNSLDPSPFTERDLDDDAEAYIVGWAREVDTGAPFRIVVRLPVSEAEKARERGLTNIATAVAEAPITTRLFNNRTSVMFPYPTTPGVPVATIF